MIDIPEFFSDIPVDENEYICIPLDYFVFKGLIFHATPAYIIDNEQIEREVKGIGY